MNATNCKLNLIYRYYFFFSNSKANNRFIFYKIKLLGIISDYIEIITNETLSISDKNIIFQELEKKLLYLWTIAKFVRQRNTIEVQEKIKSFEICHVDKQHFSQTNTTNNTTVSQTTKIG